MANEEMRPLTDEEKEQLSQAAPLSTTPTGELTERVPVRPMGDQLKNVRSIAKGLMGSEVVTGEATSANFYHPAKQMSYALPEGISTYDWSEPQMTATADLMDYMATSQQWRSNGAKADEELFRLSLAYEATTGRNAKELTGTSTAAMKRYRASAEVVGAFYNGVIETYEFAKDVLLEGGKRAYTSQLLGARAVVENLFDENTAQPISSTIETHVAGVTESFDTAKDKLSLLHLEFHQEPQTPTEEVLLPLLQAVGEFATSFLVLSKGGVLKKVAASVDRHNIRKAIAPNSLRAKIYHEVAEGAVVGAGMDFVSVERENFANFLGSIYKGDNKVLRGLFGLMSTDADDGVVVSTLKNMFVNTLLGVFFDAAISTAAVGVRAARLPILGDKPLAMPKEAAALADDALDLDDYIRIFTPEDESAITTAVENIRETVAILKRGDGIVDVDSAVEVVDTPLVATASDVVEDGAVKLVPGESPKAGSQTTQEVTHGAKRNGRMTVSVVNNDFNGASREFKFRIDGDLEKVTKISGEIASKKAEGKVMSQAELVDLIRRYKGLRAVQVSHDDSAVLEAAAKAMQGLDLDSSRKAFWDMFVYRGTGIQTNEKTRHIALSEMEEVFDIIKDMDPQDIFGRDIYIAQAWLIKSQASMYALLDVQPKIKNSLSSLEPFSEEFFMEIANWATALDQYVLSLSRFNEIKSYTGHLMQSFQIKYSKEELATRMVNLTEKDFRRIEEQAMYKYEKIFTEDVRDFLANLRFMTRGEVRKFFDDAGNKEMLIDFINSLEALTMDSISDAAGKLKPNILRTINDFRKANVLSATSAGTVAGLSGIFATVHQGVGRAFVASAKALGDRSFEPLEQFLYSSTAWLAGVPQGIGDFLSTIIDNAHRMFINENKGVIGNILEAPNNLQRAVSDAALDTARMVQDNVDSFNADYILRWLGQGGTVRRWMGRNIELMPFATELFNGFAGVIKVPYMLLTALDQLVKYPAYKAFVTDQLFTLGRSQGLKGKALRKYIGDRMEDVMRWKKTGELPFDFDPELAKNIARISTNADVEMRRMTLSQKFTERPDLRKTWSGRFAVYSRAQPWTQVLPLFNNMFANLASIPSHSYPFPGSQFMKEARSADPFVRDAAWGRFAGAASIGALAVGLYLQNEDAPVKLYGFLSKERQGNQLGIKSFTLKIPDFKGGSLYLNLDRGEPGIIYAALNVGLLQLGQMLWSKGKSMTAWEDLRQGVMDFMTESMTGRFYMESVAFMGDLMSGTFRKNAALRMLTSIAPLGGMVRSLKQIGKESSTYPELPPHWYSKFATGVERLLMLYNFVYDDAVGGQELAPDRLLDKYGKEVQNPNFVLANTFIKGKTGAERWFWDIFGRYCGIQMVDKTNFSAIRGFEFMMAKQGRPPIINEFMGNDIKMYKNDILRLLNEPQGDTGMNVEEILSEMVTGFIAENKLVPFDDGRWGTLTMIDGELVPTVFPMEELEKALSSVYSSFFEAAKAAVFISAGNEFIYQGGLPDKYSGSIPLRKEQYDAALLFMQTMDLPTAQKAFRLSSDPAVINTPAYKGAANEFRKLGASMELEVYNATPEQIEEWKHYIQNFNDIPLADEAGASLLGETMPDLDEDEEMRLYRQMLGGK